MSDMKFKKTEKEIIETIVKYDGEVKSLAEVINKSELLERRGIAFVTDGNMSCIFLKKDRYDYEDKEPLGYVTEMVSLINMLVEKRFLTIIPLESSPDLVIGRKKSRWGNKPGIVVVDESEFIQADRHMFNWLNASGEQIYWPIGCSEKVLPVGKVIYSWFVVSQELKELVKHNFKTEEQRRFSKQQFATWVSIVVAIILGLLGFLR